MEQDLKIKDNDLEAIYYFIMLNYNQLSDQEKVYWYNILKKLDPEFENND